MLTVIVTSVVKDLCNLVVYLKLPMRNEEERTAAPFYFLIILLGRSEVGFGLDSLDTTLQRGLRIPA